MPDSETYRAMLGRLNMSPDDVAFVGHDALELAGAANAGLWTIGVNYDIDAEADVLLERFERLLQAVSYQSRGIRRGEKQTMKEEG